MTSRQTLPWMLVFAGLACSAKAPTTALVITVRSDLGRELDEVVVEATGGAIRRQVLAPQFDADGAFLPLQMGLVPDGRGEQPFTVVVLGRRAKQQVVSQSARLSFVPGEVRSADLFLARMCVARPQCQGGETCYDGRCLPETRDARALPVADAQARRASMRTPPQPLEVRLTRPADVVFANGDVEVRAEISGGVAEAVYLFVDGAAVRPLAHPYQDRWDTRSTLEGPHEVVVVAMSQGRAHVSPSRTVEVDRTRPVVEAIWPPTDVRIAITGRLRLTFSETLHESSLTQESFPLTITRIVLSEGTARALIGPPSPLEAAVTLEADKKTVTLNINTDLFTEPPVEIELSRNGPPIVDRAWNAIRALRLGGPGWFRPGCPSGGTSSSRPRSRRWIWRSTS